MIRKGEIPWIISRENPIIKFSMKFILFSLLMKVVWKAQQAMIKCCTKIAQKPVLSHFVTTILVLLVKCFQLDVT